MTTWLEPAAAAVLVDVSSAASAEPDWEAAVDAAVDYVSGLEGVRRDLWSAADPPVFAATGRIKLGTAMLANRWYTRMRSPLGTSQNVEFGGSDFLRQDPDIAKMLGIGSSGRFAFGAAGYVPAVVVE